MVWNIRDFVSQGSGFLITTATKASIDSWVYRFNNFKLIFIYPIDAEKFLMPHVKIYTHMNAIWKLFLRFVKKVEVLGHKSVCTIIARVK